MAHAKIDGTWKYLMAPCSQPYSWCCEHGAIKYFQVPSIFACAVKNEILSKLIYLGIIYLIRHSMVTGGSVAKWLCCLWFNWFSLDGLRFKSHCVQIFITYFWAPYTKGPPRFQGFLWVFMGFHGFPWVFGGCNHFQLGGPSWGVGGLGEVSGGYNLQNRAWTFADVAHGICCCCRCSAPP